MQFFGGENGFRRWKWRKGEHHVVSDCAKYPAQRDFIAVLVAGLTTIRPEPGASPPFNGGGFFAAFIDQIISTRRPVHGEWLRQLWSGQKWP